MPKLNLPIRVKILLASVLMLMLVVGLITTSMARLFQNDKTTYMRDLTSVVARNVSEESNALFASYLRNLRVFMGAARDQTMNQTERQNIINTLFENYPDFVAISVIRDDLPPTVVYDPAILAEAGLGESALADLRNSESLPWQAIVDGAVYVRNVTISERLPLMNVAVFDPYSPTDQPAVIMGTIRLQPLLGVASRSSTFQIKMFDSENVILASANPKEVTERARDEPLFERIREQSTDGFQATRDIQLGGEEWFASFAPIAEGAVSISVMIPKSAAYLTARVLLRNLVYVSVVLFALAVAFALFFSHRLTRPLEILSNAASKVGRGEFNVAVKQSGQDEIGVLATSFNDMTGALRQRNQDLEAAHRALVQSEKMAAFGQLGAGIAHEVKNPLTGILGNAQLALRKTASDHPVHGKLRIIEKEAKRCSDIINNLMRFARHEKAEFAPMNVNEVIRDAIAITDHQLTINDNQVTIELHENLPLVHGNANQLQQVLMNLLINAEQAMSGKPGKVHVVSRCVDPGIVEIEVTDNGPGIPAEIQERIFEPFFTTKPSGKGTGLGMSVAFRIIEEHGGQFRLDGRPGAGARFTICLPALAEGANPQICESEPRKSA